MGFFFTRPLRFWPLQHRLNHKHPGCKQQSPTDIRHLALELILPSPASHHHDPTVWNHDIFTPTRSIGCSWLHHGYHHVWYKRIDRCDAMLRATCACTDSSCRLLLRCDSSVVCISLPGGVSLKILVNRFRGFFPDISTRGPSRCAWSRFVAKRNPTCLCHCRLYHARQQRRIKPSIRLLQ